MAKSHDHGKLYGDLLLSIPSEESRNRYEEFRNALFRDDAGPTAFTVDYEGSSVISADDVRRGLAMLVGTPKVTEYDDGTYTYTWAY